MKGLVLLALFFYKKLLDKFYSLNYFLLCEALQYSILIIQLNIRINIKNLLFIISILVQFEALSCVYGKDDRVEASSSSSYLSELARAVAVIIPGDYVFPLRKNSYYEVTTDTMEEGHGLCKSERFSEQYIASYSNCTGFLVASDILVTAAHCAVEADVALNYFKVVFNHRNEFLETEDIADEYGDLEKFLITPKENVYHFVKVLEIVESKKNGTADYAVLKLNKKVEGIRPLKFRKYGKVSAKDEMVAIGFPSGLPMKIARNGQIINNKEKNYFLTSNDTFGGNSGSPIINFRSGEVEGILIAGDKDYNKNKNKDCYEVNVCKDIKKCKGETVQRITKLKSLKNL